MPSSGHFGYLKCESKSGKVGHRLNPEEGCYQGCHLAVFMAKFLDSGRFGRPLAVKEFFGREGKSWPDFGRT